MFSSMRFFNSTYSLAAWAELFTYNYGHLGSKIGFILFSNLDKLFNLIAELLNLHIVDYYILL